MHFNTGLQFANSTGLSCYSPSSYKKQQTENLFRVNAHLTRYFTYCSVEPIRPIPYRLRQILFSFKKKWARIFILEVTNNLKSVQHTIESGGNVNELKKATYHKYSCLSSVALLCNECVINIEFLLLSAFDDRK